MVVWNPWHGCHKISDGCENCYMFRTDERVGKNSEIICKTGYFDLPVRRNKRGEFKLTSGQKVFSCMSSDFFVQEADAWRMEAWKMMRTRLDLQFWFTTKRINRFEAVLPSDWGDGYANITVCCTIENQEQADLRLPIYLALPIVHREIVCEPLLGPINLWPYLEGKVDSVVVGGESGPGARVCDYKWVLDLRLQCKAANVNFYFRQTGAKFKKGGRIFCVPRRHQLAQAKAADLNFCVAREKM